MDVLKRLHVVIQEVGNNMVDKMGIDKTEQEKTAEQALEKVYKELKEQEAREELSTLKVFKFVNEGDKINGILLELTTVPTQYSDSSPFAKIKTEDGICGIFLPYELKQVLIPELIGEKIEIIFKNWIGTKSGRKMKKFSVFRIGNKQKQENKELELAKENTVQGIGIDQMKNPLYF